MNRWISFILLFVFSILIAEAATSKIRFSHITNKDGLPSNTVFSIMQDYKGYYWLVPRQVCVVTMVKPS